MTPGRRVADIGAAVVFAALGLIEIWLPLESVQGQGSPVVCSVGVLWFAGQPSPRWVV